MYSLLVIGIGKSSLSQWLFRNSTPRANIYYIYDRSVELMLHISVLRS